MATSKEHIITLKKKLEEVEKAEAQAEKAREEAKKAREEVEQSGYDIGVAETEEALRAEVSRLCRNYYSQIWNEALNQVGVEASSVLRKAKRVYYLPAIHASFSSSSKADTPPEVAILRRVAPTRSLPPLAAFQKWPSNLGRMEKRLR